MKSLHISSFCWGSIRRYLSNKIGFMSIGVREHFLFKIKKSCSALGRSVVRSDRPWHRVGRFRPATGPVPTGHYAVGFQCPGHGPVTGPVWTGRVRSVARSDRLSRQASRCLARSTSSHARRPGALPGRPALSPGGPVCGPVDQLLRQAARSQARFGPVETRLHENLSDLLPTVISSLGL